MTPSRSLPLAAALVLATCSLQAAHPAVELVSRAHPSLISDSAFWSDARELSVSADGRFVAFTSSSPLLVEGFVDANSSYATDVFLSDRQSGTTALVSHSVTSPLQTSNGRSERPVLSGDGRYVAFVSSGGDLVPGQVDGGSWYDVFLYDRLDGSLRLVSHKSASPVTTAGAEEYGGLAVSHSGDRVAWVSRSTEVVAGQLDVPNSSDVFLFETATGSNLLVSHSDTLPPTAGYLDSANPSTSADGRHIAFVTESTNLVQGLLDLNSAQDVFLFDLDTSLVQPVSRTAGVLYATANGESSWAEVSGDGGHVAFVSQATDLVAGQVDLNFDRDVFVADLAGGTRALVSHAAGQPWVAGNRGSGDRREVVLSSDGSTVAFKSHASDLVDPPTNGRQAVFAWRSATGDSTLVSHHPDGEAAHANELAGISSDGAHLAYVSFDDVTGAGTWDYNVYAYDLPADETRLVSARAGTTNGASNGSSTGACLSADGTSLAFLSDASDLVAGVSDQNDDVDVFSWDGGSSRLVTRRSPSGYSVTTTTGATTIPSCIAGDGRQVLFFSRSAALVPGSVPNDYPADAFLFDRATGVARLVSHGAAGAGAGVGAESATVSADGRSVAFESRAGEVVPGQVDTNGSADVFLYDRLTGQSALVSHAAGAPLQAGSQQSGLLGVSADGRYVLLDSHATDLAPGVTDGNADADLYLCDRQVDACALVTHAAGSSTTTANAGVPYEAVAAVSADGAWVAYESEATDLVAGQVDSAGTLDLFIWERATGQNLLVSHTAGSPLTAASGHSNGYSGGVAFSGAGDWLAFTSRATDLVAGVSDGNEAPDVYLFERATGQSRLASHAAGLPLLAGSGWSSLPSLSADGRFAAYLSRATDLVPGQIDPYYSADVFVFDRDSGENQLVSHAAGAPATGANADSQIPTIAADGSAVAFISYASDLVAGQIATYGDNAYLVDRATGLARLASPALGPDLAGAGGLGAWLCLSRDGRSLAFTSDAGTLVAHDLNEATDVFVYGRSHVKGDLSDDLNTDLVLANRNAPVHRVWTLDGDLNRLAEIDVSPDQTGPDWQLGGVDDFDGDGQDDLVFRNTGTGSVELWMMNGATRVGAPVPLAGMPPPPEWKLSATADFDHDARPDLVWRNTATRALEIWTMNGATPTGTITPTPAQATDANWEIVAALDMDRDGYNDFVWYNRTSGRIVFWFMDAAVQRLAGQFATPMQAGNANWKVLAAGDYGVGPNGRPGTFDLVWRNADSGRFVVWHMDTLGVRTAGRFVNPPAPADPLDWTIAGPR